MIEMIALTVSILTVYMFVISIMAFIMWIADNTGGN